MNKDRSFAILLEWFSRMTATFIGVFFGGLLALIVFSLLMRFYFEMTIGQAIGNSRSNVNKAVEKGGKK